MSECTMNNQKLITMNNVNNKLMLTENFVLTERLTSMSDSS